MCTIITIVQAILPYKHTVMSDMSAYISTSSLMADSFPESTVTFDIESINGWFMLVSALFTGLTLKMMPSLLMYCECTLGQGLLAPLNYSNFSELLQIR